MEKDSEGVCPAGLRTLLLSGQVRTIAKGTVFQSSDDKYSLNLILEGFVKRYLLTNEGCESIQSVYGMDYLFPLTILFKQLFNQDLHSGMETYYYEAMGDIRICTIDVREFIKAAEADPTIYKDTLLMVGKRFQSNIQQLENCSLKYARKRVAHQLLYCARKFGKDELAGVMIAVPLAQHDIANMLNLSRETVSIGISALRKDGLITTSGTIVIPDIGRLETEAYS